MALAAALERRQAAHGRSAQWGRVRDAVGAAAVHPALVAKQAEVAAAWAALSAKYEAYTAAAGARLRAAEEAVVAQQKEQEAAAHEVKHSISVASDARVAADLRYLAATESEVLASVTAVLDGALAGEPPRADAARGRLRTASAGGIGSPQRTQSAKGDEAVGGGADRGNERGAAALRGYDLVGPTAHWPRTRDTRNPGPPCSTLIPGGNHRSLPLRGGGAPPASVAARLSQQHVSAPDETAVLAEETQRQAGAAAEHWLRARCRAARWRRARCAEPQARRPAPPRAVTTRVAPLLWLLLVLLGLGAPPEGGAADYCLPTLAAMAVPLLVPPQVARLRHTSQRRQTARQWRRVVLQLLVHARMRRRVRV